MNYATERLLAAANASLRAWEDEEESVRDEHREVIDELEAAIFYFDAHGELFPPIIVETFALAKEAPTSFEDEGWLEGFEDGRQMIAHRLALSLPEVARAPFLTLCKVIDDDADLAEAAEGDTCTACKRDSLDCSRDPCAAVIADREA